MTYVPRINTTHISKKEFGDFLLTAANGTPITYAVSNNFALRCETDREFAAIRAMAWDGPCMLVQRRVPTTNGLFEYIAIRSGRGRHHLRPDPAWLEDDYFTEARKTRRKKNKSAMSDALEFVE